MVRGSSPAAAARRKVSACAVVAVGLLTAAGACHRSAPAAQARELASPHSGTSTAVSANHCGECHPTTEDEWRDSAHARSAVSPLFLAMRKAAGTSVGDSTCDVCHAPLARWLPAGEPAVAEGITCDVCHTIREVKNGPPLERFALLLSDAVKYGPLCDAQDHYFHRMGCSPLHEESRFCAACHLYRRPLPEGGDLPVYTEFEEWRDGPAAARGQVCQDCHMPGSRAPAAVGSPKMRIVPHHGWLGANGRLRHRALQGKAEIEVGDGQIRAKVTLVNHGAGHNVPTGSPERRVVLRVFTIDDGKRELGASITQYGRFLVDAAGAPAPFFSAQRVERDNRLRPGEERPEVIELPAGGARGLRVEVTWWACDPIVGAARWPQVACEHELLLAGETSLVPRANRRAFRLRSPGPGPK